MGSHSLHLKALMCVETYKKNEAELVEILIEIDTTKSYLAFGVSSLFRYCVEKLGLSESETYRFTQVARKSLEVPELKCAIANGNLTVSKASRIAPVITKENQVQWIEKARSLPQREIQRQVAIEKPRALPGEVLRVLTADRSELRLSISIEDERRLKRLQEVLRASTLEQTLSLAIQHTLKHKDPVAKASRHQLATKQREKPGNETNPRLSTKVAFSRQTPASRQVPAGKPIRSPLPISLKHQVYLRDRGRCRYRGCNETRFIEIHHLRPVALGGLHELSNLATLCSGHHRMMHGERRARSGADR